MKIESQSIEFRNFLSYGNVPQRIDFLPGINLILGTDTGNGRSNGSGKSSFIETIPFALFGKLNRSIKKEQIINWLNKKRCEVQYTFTMNGKTFTIIRAIKPDKFEIYEDGTLIPIPSDIRTYQKMLENDILKMDLNMFMYLIYTNLNSNTPLLKMSTPQKRAFLERVFGLETFSEMNEMANTRLKDIEEKIFKNNVVVDQSKKSVDDLREQNLSLQLKIAHLSKPELSLIELEAERNEAFADVYQPNILTEMQKEMDNTTAERNTFIEEKTKYVNEVKLLETELKYAEKRISDIKDQTSKNGKEISSVKAEYYELEKHNVESLDTFENEIEKTSQLIETNIKRATENTSTFATLTERLKNISSIYVALKGGVCPTCKTIFSNEKLQDDYVKDIEVLKKSISEMKEVSSGYITEGRKLFLHKSDWIKNLSAARSHTEKKKTLLTKWGLLKAIVTTSTENDEKRVDEINSRIPQLTEWIKGVDSKIARETTILETTKASFTSIQEYVKRIEGLDTKIKEAKAEIEAKREAKENIDKILQENNTKIDVLEKENKKNITSISKLTGLSDYLTYVKTLCRDENVKQFAISTTLPYLIQQTNYYLSESGSSHYLKFDKWLDAEIHGQGIADASYGNLSGGEARSIDLAIQFAFLDIAKIRAGVFPDILLLDEILDSSIDGFGIMNLLKIIKSKQIEDGNKTYIITHRTEIADVDVDNIYQVYKREGFSCIEKQ